MSRKRPSFSDIVPDEHIRWVDGLPLPPAPPVQPVHATISVLRLLANKEDTRQVFEAASALSGDSSIKVFERMIKTPYGRRLVTEPIKAEDLFTDKDRLRAMPEDSVGRAYLDFMDGENLTPDGVLGAAEEAGIDHSSPTQFEELRRGMLHLEVCHDLWHVLTGYGRDTLGELCLLVFTYRQIPNRGLRLITAIGAAAIKAEQPRAPLLRAMAEAKHIGRGAAWLPAVDLETLLPMPLAEARAKLNIGVPHAYNAVPQSVKDSLLKPKTAKTQSQREGRADEAVAA